MGAGKSRLGKRLAKALDRQFFDLDQLIEEKMNMVVSEVFNQFGEAYFRVLERDILHEYAQKDNLVLSCGGGAPCFHQNKSVMLQHGLVIYLEVAHDELVHRLWKNRLHRPLLAKMNNQEQLSAYIREHLAARMAYYRQAHLVYDNTNPKSDLQELIQFIQNEFHS